MTVEQKVIGLMESQRRIEKLLAYYREPGQQELSFVHSLEARLEAVRRELKDIVDDIPLRRRPALSFAA